MVSAITQNERKNEMKELKPCPFCGGEAISGLKWTEYDGGDVWIQACVKCKSCNVTKSKTFRLSGINLAPFEEAVNAINTVTANWNERKGK